MQIVRAIDSTGDWTFGAGLSNYRSNLEAVEQNIKTRLQSFLGNCFFAMQDGVNWYLYLGSKGNNNALQASVSIAAVLLNTEDVVGILQLSFDISNTRSFSVSYQVQTVYSVTGNTFEYALGGSS